MDLMKTLEFIETKWTTLCLTGIPYATTPIFVRVLLNPLPDDKILDWSKLKQIADNILKRIQN